MSIEILMPALSPTMTEGKLARWLKAEGDSIKSGDIIAEIETDKATMEMEAVDEGVLGKILVEEGSEGVSVNQPIGILLEDGEPESVLKESERLPLKSDLNLNVNREEKKRSPKKQIVPSDSIVKTVQMENKSSRIFSSPLARRIAAEAGLDIAKMHGSGPNGRIVKKDVEQAISASTGLESGAQGSRTVQIPNYDQPYKEVPNSSMRKTIARRLVEAKSTIPHFYLTIDCQIGELLKIRKEINGDGEDGYKISVNDFIIKASALALRKVPQANASWTEESVRLYDNVDISIAVSTPEGLITPIVRSAELKSLVEISSEVKDLAKRARDKKLKPDEYQGGGFSISNLGMFGIREFSAVINPPQVCILAVGRGEKRAVVNGDTVAISDMMTCTLSCDHRVVDGAVGAEFLQSFQMYIENPIRMLL
ncbi:MAG: pyruvate dehydrogenase complex dihydrolipoamide acetyltransferase [Candidatus Marinimicrobia bacterium]|nr:pyruvate dehydrogenase complex dihydrolipoamide acetyltransferase [Candidatus Neomarinimicrobiota bacterium]